MAHASKIVHCSGPDDPHALDHIPVRPRHGALDVKCPVCHGHGAWNTEIDLISHRSKRACCANCHGSGWIEIGDDPVALHQITMSEEGYPKWGTRHISGVEPEKEE